MSEETTSTVDEQSTQDEGTTPETVEAPADDKPETPMIPKARFDEVNGKLKELKKAADELEALKQAQADEAAAKANDIEKFKSERDQYKSQAAMWEEYATSKLEALTEQLDDTGKGVLEQLGDDVALHKRVAIAEQLAAQKKADPGMGTKGGKASGDVGGLIPSEVGSMGEYHTWMANLSMDPEGRALLADRQKMAKIRDEARRKFG